MGDQPTPDGSRLVAPDAVPPDAGGDAACWLAAVCPACGAFNEGPAASCWNCGRNVPDASPDPR